MRLKHPFRSGPSSPYFGGMTQQIIGGFTIEGDIAVQGGGTSHHIKVTLDSPLISEMEVRQVNDKSAGGGVGTILNNKTWESVSMVRRTGPKNWEFRTLANQGSAERIGLAMLHITLRIYGPAGEVIWEKEIGRSMTADDLNDPEMLLAVVKARGGWQVGDARPNRVGKSGTRNLVTGMTPELLATLMPDVTTPEMDAAAEEEAAAAATEEEEAENALTTQIMVGGGIGASVLIMIYSLFRIFGGRRNRRAKQRR